ncbi:IclR family transcriptional regulator [Rhodococcus sp. NPDC056960]|uniref:IclR family transcriptional regulator n=1 Tax=Rhodococcus sp. NPDC056960 TaxID=3345982 RepID=UPI0036331052
MVQSVDRAISILEVIARKRSSGVTAIAGELGLNKTTVFRLLATLESRGLVEQNEDRGEYRLGFTAGMLAAGAVRQPDTAAVCRPYSVELADRVGETVNVAILDGSDVMTLDQVTGGSSTIASIDWIGRRAPIHATAAGKLLLAYLPPTERDRLLPDPLVRYTDHTVTDRAVLDAQLEAIRAEDVSYCFEENEIGVVALGAPIRRLDGEIIASLNLTGPTFRVTAEVLPDLRDALRETAERISWKFGWSKRA